MAASPSLLLITCSSDYHILILFFSIFFLFSSLCILVFSLYTIRKQTDCSVQKEQQKSGGKPQSLPVNNSSSNSNDSYSCKSEEKEEAHESDPASLMTHSLLLEILPSNSPKWDSLFVSKSESCDDPDEKNGPGQEKKKRKKRARKKKPDPGGEEEVALKKEELVCLYPFTKSSSATQRKIKQQYDQLVKSHESNALTLAQVAAFVNCLVEARNELQHKSEVIKRKFTIAKALLFKADRSSFDRLRQQIYKLELEQKRLEEDAFVYNWLQQQLKLSPAYKKMLELGASMDVKAKCDKLVENTDADFSDNISFEELLAQEKKDAFWQRNGRLRGCSG